MDNRRLINILESLLLSHNKPLPINKIKEVFDSYYKDKFNQQNELSTEITNDFILKLLSDLSSRYQNTSLELVSVSSGYRLQIRQDYSLWVSLLLEEKPQKYSRAFLETLALIAYKQPITRGEIEEIRGVSVNSHTIKTLIEREWIRIIGHKDVPGKPALYATTKNFLDYFSLNKLDELPMLNEVNIKEIITA
ncbi:MAG: SMC-Scp complex subunit ScpB [Gammaproteobacteria bacterium]|nr:SMC-Scp complex subunit ScpB [Gammaproteobacteria bacterium]